MNAQQTRSKGGILVIEDDAFVQDVMKHHLTQKGYDVWVAADAAIARRMMDEHSGEVRLLIVDSRLPEQSGESIADELTARFGKCVLLVSGYPRPDGPEPYPFLQKPFTGAQLVACVEELVAL